MQTSQDTLNLLHARHEVRRAEIKVSGNEFVGKIEAEKNNLTLEEARRNLTQLDADIKTHAETNRAALAVVEEKRRKARDRRRLRQQEHREHDGEGADRRPRCDQGQQGCVGRLRLPWHELPDYREGDTVQPGSTVAEVVDLTEMEVKTKIPETERASMNGRSPGEGAARGDARHFADADSKGVGGLAQNAFWEPQTTHQFRTTFALATRRPRFGRA